MAKIKTMVGVTAGIFNKEGKLLLRRRKEHDSVTDRDYYGCWELPVVAAQDTDERSIPYHYLSLKLAEGVEAEIGIKILVNPMPAFYPVMFKNDKGEYDLAMITSVGVVKQRPPKDKEVIYVSPQKLNELAEEYAPVKKDKEGKIIQEGRGLLGGKGKRQHCMALKVIETACSDITYRRSAKQTLKDIQEGWR